jgi:hypothetical protein
MATKKATAPAPPPTSFTGQISHPTLRERLFHWNRKRRAQKLARPKRPININLGGNGQQTTPAQRRRRTTRLPRGHTYRRKPRRGTIAAVLGVAIAATALTLATVEFVSWTAATELGLAAEGVSMLTAYCFGEPSDRAKLKKAQNVSQPPKQPRQRQQPKPPQKSAGHRCGAPTQDGSPCNRPVKNASDNCWEHPGGQGTGTSAGNKKTASGGNTGPKKTRSKGAAPPAPAGQSTP